jgi:hypothetical protein
LIDPRRAGKRLPDVGLISEEYDTVNSRLVGNFPQAFAHVGIINTAQRLAAVCASAADAAGAETESPDGSAQRRWYVMRASGLHCVGATGKRSSSCPVIVAFCTEHLLGVVVNWPSVWSDR